MNKEFLPYEQALALKKLGFDEPCFGYYISTSYYNSKKEKKYRKAILYHGHFNKNSLSEFDDNKSIQVIAPLYQQAFRWFRENYDLYFPINLDDCGQYYFEVNNEYDVCRNTYEEAELECLKKLIEIVKNK